MNVGIIRNQGRSLLVDCQRVRGIALIQIILTGIHQAEVLLRRIIWRNVGSAR